MGSTSFGSFEPLTVFSVPTLAGELTIVMFSEEEPDEDVPLDDERMSDELF